MVETPFDLDFLDDERLRCDNCNVRHGEEDRQRCVPCGEIFCGEDCLADHVRAWHASTSEPEAPRGAAPAAGEDGASPSARPSSASPPPRHPLPSEP